VKTRSRYQSLQFIDQYNAVAPSNLEELLPKQNRDLVEQFISGHDIRCAVAVYVGHGQRPKTKPCGKILRVLKSPITVSIEHRHGRKGVSYDQIELSIIVGVSRQDHRWSPGIEGKLPRGLHFFSANDGARV
jgi:hypothetical protein